MNTTTDPWTVDLPPIIYDDTAVGFYADPPLTSDIPMVFYVRHNKAGTNRYAHQVQKVVHRGEHRLELWYRGKAPLYDLTSAHKAPIASVLRLFAGVSPFDTCLFCRRPLTEPIPQTFGLGFHCAANHLGISRRFLTVLYARLDPPPTNGTPRPLPARVAPSALPERHLRLVAVNGQRVAA